MIRSALTALVLGALSALCVLWFDVPIARWFARWPEVARTVAHEGTSILDRITGKKSEDIALPSALLVIGLVLHFWPTRRGLARLLVLVALSCFVSHFIVGFLKPLLGRGRPYQIAEEGWVDHFFVGGSSFPSGHTAFYWGLALPLAHAWPRRRAWILLPAAFVAAARVVEGDHFTGDVLASLAITVLVSALLDALLPGGRAREPEPVHAESPGKPERSGVR